MPAIRSRMSSSSSTMRISDAINDPFLLIFQSLFIVRCFGIFLREGQSQRDFGTLPVFGIGEGDLAAMVFHDFAHNRQTKPGALAAGGDIGLGQAMAMFRRQSHAVVG